MIHTFTFKSGYTISTRDDYNPRTFNLAMEAWRENNPAPEPPEKEFTVPQKGGPQVRTKKDWNDPDFAHAHALWEQAGNDATAETLMVMAVDTTSLDRKVLDSARAWGAENSVPIPENDLKAFLQVVSEDGEIREFFRWLNQLESPDGALIGRYIKMFQSGSEVPRQDDVSLGSSNGEYVGVASAPQIDVPSRG